MSFSIRDQQDLANIISLSSERQHELLKKLAQLIKELKKYRNLQKNSSFKITDKVALEGYKERFPKLRSIQELSRQIAKLSQYQQKLGKKIRRDKPLVKKKRTFLPAHHKQEDIEKLKSQLIDLIENQGMTEIEALLKNKALLTPTSNLAEALVYAIQLSNAPAVEALLEAGVSANTEFTPGHSVLHMAVENGEVDITDFLLKYRANPNQEDADGKTPLTIMAEKGDRNICAHLLKHGAVPNLEDGKGNLPLIIAARSGHTEAGHLLLEAGASPNLADGKGNLPLISAISFGKTEGVQLLLEAGADPLLRTKSGPTAMDYVVDQGKPALYKLLKEAIPKSLYRDVNKKSQIFAKMGHVLGVKMTLPVKGSDGRVFELGSIGLLPHYSVSWMMHFLNNYCKKLKAENQEDVYQDFRRILKAYTLESKRLLLDPKVGMEEVLDAYRKGEPIFVSGGWKKHTIGTAFYGKRGGFINRGAAGIHPDYGTGSFEIANVNDVNEDLMKSIRSSVSNGPEVMSNITFLPKGNPIGFLGTKKQKWGTCAYANVKPGVELLLYWFALEAGKNEIEARSYAWQEYKKFTEFTRDEMCKELASNYQSHLEDREFYKAMFEAIIKMHHGITVKPNSRNLRNKQNAELRRAAILLQAISDVNKKEAAEFFMRFDSMQGAALIMLAKKNNCTPLIEVLTECGAIVEEPTKTSTTKVKY